MERSKSMDFATRSAAAAEQAMRKHIDALSQTAKTPEEVAEWRKEMAGFLHLYSSYVHKDQKQPLVWSKIRPPPPNLLVGYEELEKCDPALIQELLNKLVVLKLNGGLGTSMGCKGPKSAIEVRSGATFLDLTVRQIEHLNKTYAVNVPLVLMNSFNTHEDTQKIIKRYEHSSAQILTFNQHKHPRIVDEHKTPLPKSVYDGIDSWCPPGHGDVYEAFLQSDVFKLLKQQGKEFVFISNVDNLGATVDLNILYHFSLCKAEFIMELTEKTRADVKGGTLIDYDGNARLLEIAQVPADKVNEFKSIKKFKIFNTNNLWCTMAAIERVVASGDLNEMDVIPNSKVVDGSTIIQLERAAGAAMQFFKGAHGVNVPRSRFLPVKSTSDLLIIQSNLYSLENGCLVFNPKRPFPTVPLVKLGDEFKTVAAYSARIKHIPNILELHHLTISGDVTLGDNVTLAGTVIIVANHGSRIDIPSHSFLEEKVVSGNLRILDH